MSFSSGGQGHSDGEETGVQSSQSTSESHGQPPTAPPKGVSSPRPCGPTRTHHGCSVGTLTSVVLSPTAFSWTRALRARAWAPNFRACLRQVWSSETESSEGTWGYRHCQFCKFRTPLPTAHPQPSLLTLPRC